MSINIKTMPPQITKRYNTKVLATPQRNLIHNLGASVTTMPNNSGIIETQSRYDPLEPFTVPLDDAQTNPIPQVLNRFDIDCRLRTYATYILLTKEVTMTNQDGVLNNAAKRLGQAYWETKDILQRDNLSSTAGFINCTDGNNGDFPTNMAPSDVYGAISFLYNKSGQYFTELIQGMDKFNTSPVGDAYLMFCSARMIPVFKAMPQGVDGFIDKFRYPRPDLSLNSEFGAISNVRVFVSELGSIEQGASALGRDVANCFLVAREAYKVVDQLDGNSLFHYTPAGYLNDPCKLRHAVSCKIRQGNCLNNDSWVLNLRSSGI